MADIIYPFWPYPMRPDKPRNQKERRFWAVHAVVPVIYVRLDGTIQRLLVTGREHYAVDYVWNRFRWDTRLETPGEFKINDHLKAYYARLWLQDHPTHWGFFELRRCEGEYPQGSEPGGKRPRRPSDDYWRDVWGL